MIVCIKFSIVYFKDSCYLEKEWWAEAHRHSNFFLESFIKHITLREVVNLLIVGVWVLDILMC